MPTAGRMWTSLGPKPRVFCSVSSQERWIAPAKEHCHFFGSLRGGEGPDGDDDATAREATAGEATSREIKTEQSDSNDNNTAAAAVPAPPAPDPTPSAPANPPSISKPSPKIPSLLWFAAGNHPPRPTIARYQAIEAARQERYTAARLKRAAEKAQKALEKAQRKDALKCEGGLTGFIASGIANRRKRDQVNGDNALAGLRGGAGPSTRLGWLTDLKWKLKRRTSDHVRVDINDTNPSLSLRGGADKPRMVDPNTPVPKNLWFFAGGRGHPPTLRGWNKKYRQRKMRKKIRPGAAGEFLGVGDWGLSEESKEARKKKGWKGTLKRLLNGGKD